MTTQATIADQLAQLPNLPMKNLWALWDEFFDQRPGHHHRTYLENRLAYKLQERAFGSLSPAHIAGSGRHRADVGDDALGTVARSRITAHCMDAC